MAKRSKADRFSLLVEYKGGQSFETDAAITGVVGRDRDGSGFSFADGSRDLSFAFAREAAANAAKERVKAAFGRKVCARVVSS
jgi:hypothetical protein